LRLDVRVAEGDDTARLQVLVRATEREKLPASDELAHVFDVLQDLEHIQGIALPGGRRIHSGDPGDLLAPTTLMNRRVYLAPHPFSNKSSPAAHADCTSTAGSGSLQGKTVADVRGSRLYLAAEAERVLIIESDQLAIDAGERTRSTWVWTTLNL
jgi:hypothetical protein